MTKPNSQSLNPHARVFVPGAVGGPPACPTPEHDEDNALHVQLLQLPSEVLASITASLQDPKDLLGLAITSKQMLAVLAEAAVQLHLAPGQVEQLTNPANSSKVVQMLLSLVKYMPATSCLDLSGLPLELPQLHQLAARLPHLTALKLAECKKLVPPLASALIWRPDVGSSTSSNSSTTTSSSREAASTSSTYTICSSPSTVAGTCDSATPGCDQGDGQERAAVRTTTLAKAGQVLGQQRLQLLLPRLQLLNLQRCYQLDSSCLAELLLASCHLGSQMTALAVSHLDMRSWPDGGSWTAAADSYQLALHHLFGWPLTATEGQQDTLAATGTGTAVGGAASVAAAAGLDRADQQGGAAAGCGRWPRGVQLSAWGPSSLRVLVLNNCTALSLPGLAAVSGCCPALEFLLLGGASMAPIKPQVELELGSLTSTHAVAAAAAAGGAMNAPGSAAGPGTAAGDGALATAAAVAVRPASVVEQLWLAAQVLEQQLQLPQELPVEYVASYSSRATAVVPAPGQEGTSPTHSSAAAAAEGQQDGLAGLDVTAAATGAEAGAAATGRRRVGRPCRILAVDANQVIRQHRERLHLPSELAQELRCQGLVLAAALLQLPRLQVAEVTFFPAHVVGWLSCVLHRAAASPAGNCVGTGGAAHVQSLQHPVVVGTSVPMQLQQPLQQWGVPEVWDLSTAGGVEAAMIRLAHTKTAERCNAAAVDVLPPSAVKFALECSVNCSSRSRMTPLHAAAEAGDGARCAALIGWGAQLAARTNHGASALFVACEGGCTQAVHVLLAAGADPLAGTTSGETPLYISALRGHLEVVKALLGCLQRRGVDWQDSRWYGDGWTPLMASAVADHTAVAQCLLQAAGCAAQQLLLLPNRYGQTVLHIAARKGSLALLRLLLEVGGARGVRLPDAAGDTPLDVARRCRHQVAMSEFRSAMAAGPEPCPPAIAGMA